MDAAWDRLNQILTNEEIPKKLKKFDKTGSGGTASRVYENGAIILSEYEPGTETYLIESGKVKVIAVEEDSQKVLAYLGPGEFFGEMAVLDQEPRSATIIAVEPTKVNVVPHDSFMRMVKESPDSVIKLIQQSCKRLSAYAVNYPHLFQSRRYN